MKKVLVFLLTMAMLVNTVAFAAMVIPSETSPNPLSSIDDTTEGYFNMLSILPEDESVTSNGTTSGAMIYNNYLVVPSVFWSILDNDRNRLTVYDLSLNDPSEVVSWNLGEMGVPYVPTSDTDSTPSTDLHTQPTIYGLEMDTEYIYMAVAKGSATYLYIFTNPLSGELQYDDDGNAVVETPELVSGPTQLAASRAHINNVWYLNQRPYINKIGDYILYVNKTGVISDAVIAYVDVSDAANPVKKAYDAATVFTYEDESGEKVTLGTNSVILGVEFDGNIGYFAVSDNASATTWLNAHLIKVDFKYPTSPVTLDEVTLKTGDAERSNNYPTTMSVSVTGGNIYLTPINRGGLSDHFWKINPDTMEILDHIKGNADVSQVFKFYDTGDMLIAISGQHLSRQTWAVRFGDKDAETGMTTVTRQNISAVTSMQSSANLDASVLDIIPYGTKLYFPFGLGGAYNKNAYKQATVGYIDMDQFGPFTFTVDTLPAVAYDSYTVSGSITTPATVAECGVHLYINGNTEPVDAEIIYDTVFGSVVYKWQYTLEGAGVYNVVAKVYDEYGDYDNIAESFKITIKSTDGLNAATNYSVLSDEPYVTLPETVKTITAAGFDANPETWVTGYDYRNGYLAMSMTNRNVYYTSTNSDSTAEKDAETSAYIIDDNKVRARNQLVFYNLNADGTIGTEAKVYDGIDLGMSKTLCYNKPSRYTGLATIYGMTMDEDYVYILATEPRADHFVVNYYMYIYENPYNKATGEFDDTLTKVSSVVVNNSNAGYNQNLANNIGAYNDMQKITYDGKEYIGIVDHMNSKYAVVDVTDKTAPVKNNITAMTSFTHNGLSMSTATDMDFDGNYAYIAGQNNGTITEATDEAEASISGAYYVMYKVDFSNPTAPTVINSWKLLDADFDYLNREGHSTYASNTALTPSVTIDISGEKVIATLSSRTYYMQDSLKEKLGSLKAYVLEGETITPLSAGPVTTSNNARGVAVTYVWGSEHVYYVDGMYYAYRIYPMSDYRFTGNYVIGTASALEANSENGSKQAYTTDLPIGARLLSAFEIGSRLYTNYWLAPQNGASGPATTYGAISCIDFTDVYPYITKVRIDGENIYYAEVELENNSGSAVDFTPVAALYKGGQLIDATVGSEVSLAAGETYSEKLSLDVQQDTDYSEYIIKTFIFEDITNIKPLTMSMSIND